VFNDPGSHATPETPAAKKLHGSFDWAGRSLLLSQVFRGSFSK
jgi:hypothetical protein